MAVRADHIFRWDLDKTYLRTEFDTLRDLVKSALESASDKQAFPGAAALLRALRRNANHRICIISGSPSQMRQVLAAKLALDGVEYDEFVLKNNLRNLLRMRFRALRSQVPYKLPTLLESRLGVIGTPPETLFGDDAEADAIIYSLYADILAGSVQRDELARVLDAARSYPDQKDRALALADQVRTGDAVQRILIHLDRRTPTATFASFGRRLVPIYNYFQAALILFQDRLINAQQILTVARDMIASNEHDPSTLATSLQDLIRRGRIDTGCAEELSLALHKLAEGSGSSPLGEQTSRIAWAFAERVRALGGAPPLEWPAEEAAPNYVDLVDAEYQRRRDRKR